MESYLIKYSYSKGHLNGVKIMETCERIVIAGARDYAEKKLRDFHKSRGEEVESINKITETI